MEAVLAAVWASPPSGRADDDVPLAPADDDPAIVRGQPIQISFNGVTRWYTDLGRLDSADEVKRRIARSFGLGSCEKHPFVLRAGDGAIVPISTDLPSGAVLHLEQVEQSVLPQPALRPWEGTGAPAAGTPRLQWLQEPPKGSCEWLSCKVSKSGAARPLRHLFAVEVVVSDPGQFSENELRGRMQQAEIRLFTPGLQEKTHLVHQGAKVVTMDAAQNLHIRWDGVGIKEVSSTQSDGEADGKMVLGRTGGRCAAGWYHMAISAPGLADLWLRSSTDANDLAKVVVKHKRCYKTGRWELKRIGPYADHSKCVPSHIDASSGRRLCCEGCQ